MDARRRGAGSAPAAAGGVGGDRGERGGRGGRGGRRLRPRGLLLGGVAAGGDPRRRPAGRRRVRRLPQTLVRRLGPTLLVTGGAAVLAGTALMAASIFGPVRRRLATSSGRPRPSAQGRSTRARAEDGGDEVADLARSFNLMAADLAARAREVEGADRARRLLLADVSHELMTPLTSMRGYLETLAMPAVAADGDARTLSADRRRRDPAARAHRRRPAGPGPARGRRHAAGHPGRLGGRPVRRGHGAPRAGRRRPRGDAARDHRAGGRNRQGRRPPPRAGAAEPGGQRAAPHAGRRRGPRRLPSGGIDRGDLRSATPAAASIRSTCRISSTGSTRSMRLVAGSKPAAGWDCRS